MTRKKTARRASIHAVLLFEIRDQFLYKGRAPRPVVYRVGKNMVSHRAMGVEIYIDHLRPLAISHRLQHFRNAAERTQMIAAVAMDRINGRIPSQFRRVVT